MLYVWIWGPFTTIGYGEAEEMCRVHQSRGTTVYRMKSYYSVMHHSPVWELLYYRMVGQLHMLQEHLLLLRHSTHKLKELLAIVFACEHFDVHTYGRDLEIETDHQPSMYGSPSIIHQTDYSTCYSDYKNST